MIQYCVDVDCLMRAVRSTIYRQAAFINQQAYSDLHCFPVTVMPEPCMRTHSQYSHVNASFASDSYIIVCAIGNHHAPGKKEENWHVTQDHRILQKFSGHRLARMNVLNLSRRGIGIRGKEKDKILIYLNGDYHSH